MSDTVRRFLPEVADEPLDDLYLDLEIPEGEGRPHVYLDMVASVDGAATLRGRTGELGGPADNLAFSRLRETCDAVLVGAGTVRIEDYGPPPLREGGRQRRLDRGLEPYAELVVVTASADLDLGSRLFSDPDRPPILLVPEDAPEARLARIEERADVVRVGDGRVDLERALEQLFDRGLSRVLCEGGPALNQELLDSDLVDELFLTMTPMLVGASGHRIVDGAFHGAPRDLELTELRMHRSELLLRYRLP